MPVSIRLATLDDVDTIADFNQRLATETEDRELDLETLRRGVSAIIQHPDNGQYWVAEVNGKIAAQIGVTYEWSDWRNGRMWWIQSVYVHGDFRRQGIFSQLYEYVASLASEDEHACGLRLYVEKDNKRAMATYHDLGMKMTDYRIMEATIR